MKYGMLNSLNTIKHKFYKKIFKNGDRSVCFFVRFMQLLIPYIDLSLSNYFITSDLVAVREYLNWSDNRLLRITVTS